MGVERVVILTCAMFADAPEDDDAALAEALRRRGIDVRFQVWDDPAPLRDAETVIVRSTWDYHLRHLAFNERIDAIAREHLLINDVEMIHWNIDKRYLLDVAEAGVPIVPTVMIVPCNPPDVGGIMRRNGWSAAVVKPSVGANSEDVTFVASLDDEDRAWDAAVNLQRRSNVLVQEFMPNVRTSGEHALIYIDGVFSHVVRKKPFDSLPPGEKVQTVRAEADDALRALGASALRFVEERFGTPAYARIDAVRDPHDRWRIMEVELIEPSLYLNATPDAADRLADAVVRRMRDASRGLCAGG
ncbi:MAG: hypothetical protein JO103_05995 [Candidatus Eremiobacteraeota bacterium]|nr:hypothetical protein [Candidatus Eremiobacteraeota bacterium]